jgi:hypothetical protein
MKKIITSVIFALLSISGIASAAEYSCKVYCLTNNGEKGYVYVSVYADTADEAAGKASDEADSLCSSANYSDATPGRMYASQCKQK